MRVCSNFRSPTAGAPMFSPSARPASSMIVEIKSSVADFRADRKWTAYRDFRTAFISLCRTIFRAR